MSAELEKLKRERGFIKGNLTRQIKYYDGVASMSVEENLTHEMEARLNKIEPLLDEFTIKQNEIELSVSEDELDAQIQERDNFESLYFALIGKLRAKVNSFYNSLKVQQSSSSSDTQSVINVNVAENAPQTRSKGVELPALKLPKFDGDFRAWLEFRDGFKALIHENRTLSDVQRFYYLRSCLGSDALALIESIQVTEGNYKIAWDMLHDRYEQKSLLIHSHIRVLFEYPAIENESYTNLRHFFDSMTKNLRALNVLGEDTDKWDRLLIYLFSSKVDKTTRREWELFKISGDLPTLHDFNQFLDQRCKLLEKIEVSTKQSESNKSVDKERAGRKFNKGSYASTQNSSGISCYFCKRQHSVFQCQKLLSFSPADRCNEIKKVNLCKNCLRPGHDVLKCVHSGCKKCGRYHNTLLHIHSFKGYENKNTSEVKNSTDNVEKQIKRENTSEKSDEQIKQTFHASSSEGSNFKNIQVLLSTAIVFIKDKQGKIHECRALLDSGSQSNFVTERLCKQLNLPMEKVNYKIVGVGESVSHLNNRVNLTIMSCSNDYKATIECLVLKRITDKLPTATFNQSILKIPQNIRLADNKFNQSRDIDLLIGSSLFWEILQDQRIQVENSKLVLRDTLLGWILGGVISESSEQCKAISCFSTELEKDSSLENVLTRFWEVEEVNSCNSYFSDEENFCESEFSKNLQRASDGKFIVSIPFKNQVANLGESREYALQRYFSQERKLSKNATLKTEYDKFMLEYIQLEHMSEVSERDERKEDKLCYYLPHHAIVRESSKTTRVRVVFDASMKTDSGLSLNDIQCVGPTLQDDLFSIILRFRKHPFVMTADVSKMYRMIWIKEDQRSLHRIFWREDPATDLKCYELKTVTYGTASAPYLAVRCLIQLSNEFEKIYPKACESIKNSFYMDDYLEGASSEEELLELQMQVSKILVSAGLQLRKWLCNNKDLLHNFKVDTNLDSSVLDINEGEGNKTLGILWESNSDIIQYSVPNFNNQQIINKRTILSAIAKIYDPLGLLGPIVIVAKLLMQSLWQNKFGWDEPLSNEIVNSWLQYKNSLPTISSLKIPRMVISQNYVAIELHGFADASQKAYGCCIYIKCQIESGEYFSHLLCAKSRVAPIKKVLTLPRLELCASLLLAQLTQKTLKSLKIKFDKCYLYSDSEITLSWIRGSASKWKLFVANRVSEIQQLTDINDWYHVSTDHNRADLISRGTSVQNLIGCSLWWNGPEWLSSNDLNNFINKTTSDLDNLPERKTIVNTAIKQNFDIFSRFSKLHKLKRVFAYCLRFIYNCKTKNKILKRTGFLSNNELQDSLENLISMAQQESFPVDFDRLSKGLEINRKSSLLSLNPSIQNNLIRVGGRLQNSNHNYDKKFPIILPSKHILTRLILEAEHSRLFHCGPTMLLASIRERFWPVRGRNICKKVVKECVTCFKLNPTSSKYIMGSLPDSRVTSSLPFTNTGCDFAGPFFLKDRLTRGAKLTKGYVCIFICFASKAIHLEVMSDLTTNCFMAAFKRFVGRRGKPLNVYSDNGKTFISADKELQRLHSFVLEQSTSDDFNYFIVEQNINWHFIPSRAPNFGGIWEAGVKSFKYHFKRVVGEAHLHFEDFCTIIVQVEAILNSRPLCPLSPSPDQLNPLTPAHFLIGRSLIALPERDVTQINENRLKRFERLQKLIQHFWTRWSREYISELQVRSKWKLKSDCQFKVGTIVLVVEDNCFTMKWPMGRVEAVHPGSDGVIRVVTLRINNKLLKRPVSKICVFPFEQSFAEETDVQQC